jgi:hypothetical protein
VCVGGGGRGSEGASCATIVYQSPVCAWWIGQW